LKSIEAKSSQMKLIEVNWSQRKSNETKGT